MRGLAGAAGTVIADIGIEAAEYHTVERQREGAEREPGAGAAARHHPLAVSRAAALGVIVE
jgi:hypothetical protein